MSTKVNNKKSPMNHSELLRRQALMQRGFTVSNLAQRLHLSHAFISMLISGKRRSEEAEKKISKLVGIPRNTLWSRQ